jgi:hypothetical protein
VDFVALLGQVFDAKGGVEAARVCKCYFHADCFSREEDRTQIKLILQISTDIH